MTVFRFARIFFALVFAHCPTSINMAHADADGPDFYRVLGVPQGASVPLRDRPGAATFVGALPANATCVRNLGCQGGLTLQEFTSLSESERAERLIVNPRWCKVAYQGLTGWVEAKLLTEAPCANPDGSVKKLVLGVKPVTVRGTIKGDGSADFRIEALAGQTLTVLLNARHPQTYFNLIPTGSQEAMFIGSIAGNRAEVVIPSDGEYTLQVHLMRAAARRESSSDFTISASLQGQGLAAILDNRDALVRGTPFHATAVVQCAHHLHANLTSCDAGVIRRGFDGTATVQIRWPQGVRHILFVGGKARASDSAQAMTSSRKGEATKVQIGAGEIFEIPDALLTGG